MRGILMPALCCALVATTAQGQDKSLSGGDFSDPFVIPRVVQETFQAIVEAPTTGYVGFTTSNSSFTGDGSLRSTNCPNACQLVAGLPAGGSRMGFGMTAGARNVTRSGLFVGGEVFAKQGSNSVRTTNSQPIPMLPGIPAAAVEYTQSFRIGREIGARLLMGVELDQLRLYGAVGAANATTTMSVESDILGQFGQHSASRTGRVLGAGIEYDVTRNITIRADLSRTRYGRATYGTGNNGVHSLNMSRTNASIGLFLRN